MTGCPDECRRLLALTITPEQRAQRGRTRVIEDALRLVRLAYDEAVAAERAVVQIDVTVRKP